MATIQPSFANAAEFFNSLLDLPPELARSFLRDMRAFFICGHDTIKVLGWLFRRRGNQFV
jgi:hypothetical protein